jgi:hypothetical protein
MRKSGLKTHWVRKMGEEAGEGHNESELGKLEDYSA